MKINQEKRKNTETVPQYRSQSKTVGTLLMQLLPCAILQVSLGILLSLSLSLSRIREISHQCWKSRYSCRWQYISSTYLYRAPFCTCRCRSFDRGLILAAAFHTRNPFYSLWAHSLQKCLRFTIAEKCRQP